MPENKGYTIFHSNGSTREVSPEHTPIIDKLAADNSDESINNFYNPNHIPSNTVSVQKDGRIKDYDVRSKEYKDLYDSGHLTSYDAKTNTYYATPLDEATVTADSPQWVKYGQDYQKQNPKSAFINEYLTPFARSLGNSENNYPSELDDEYQSKINQYIAQQTYKNNPIKYGESRGEYLDRLVTRFDDNGNKFKINKLNEILHSNLGESDSTQENVWRDSWKGIRSLTENSPHQTFDRIINDRDMSMYEKQQLLNNYTDNPVLNRLSETAGILSPLFIPYNSTVGMAYTQQQGENSYDLTKALSGQVPKNEDMMLSIVADPLNLAGLNIWKGLKNTNKFKNLEKASQSIRGLSREEDLNKLSNVLNESKSVEYNPSNNLIIKSIEDGSPLENSLNKYGELNINNLNAYINNSATSKADKYILQKVVDTHFPGKTNINYNELKNKVSDELVYLDKQSGVEPYSYYGANRLGFPRASRSSFEKAIENANREINNISNRIKDFEKFLKSPSEFKAEYPDASLNKTDDELIKIIQDRLIDYKDRLSQFEEHINGLKEEMSFLPKENKTITFSNERKFGSGRGDIYDTSKPDKYHYGESVLGHTRYLISNEEPDVFHVLESQSDFYQKDRLKDVDIESYKSALHSMDEMLNRKKEILKRMKKYGLDAKWKPIKKYQIDLFENWIKEQEKYNFLRRGDLANFEQKKLLGDTWQERWLQENIHYASRNGQSKLRYPTSETAAKIQNYSKKTLRQDLNNFKINREMFDIKEDLKNINPNEILNPHEHELENFGIYNPVTKQQFLEILDNKIKELEKLPDEVLDEEKYSSKHQTILKKYSDFSKMSKKTLGIEPKIVTDVRGNTWYELDVQKSIKDRKGKIKALSTLPLGIGLEQYFKNQQNNKE